MKTLGLSSSEETSKKIIEAIVRAVVAYMRAQSIAVSEHGSGTGQYVDITHLSSSQMTDMIAQVKIAIAPLRKK